MEAALKRDLMETVHAVAFSPDGSLLASGGSDKILRVWSVPQGRLHWAKRVDMKIWSIAFLPGGDYLAAGLSGDTIALFPLRGGRLDQPRWLPKPRRPLSSVNNVIGLTFSPDGERLYSVNEHGALKIWQREQDWAELKSKGGGWLDSYGDLSLSPDGNILALAKGSGGLSVRHPDTAADIRPRDLKGVVRAVAFSPQAMPTLLLATGLFDGSISLNTLQEKNSPGQTVPVLEVLRSDTLPERSKSITRLVFSRDGSLLASSGGVEIKLWSVAQQHRLATFTGHLEKVVALAFSADGKLLASGSRDGSVRIWDVLNRSYVAAAYGFGEKDYFIQMAAGWLVATEVAKANFPLIREKGQAAPHAFAELAASLEQPDRVSFAVAPAAPGVQQATKPTGSGARQAITEAAKPPSVAVPKTGPPPLQGEPTQPPKATTPAVAAEALRRGQLESRLEQARGLQKAGRWDQAVAEYTALRKAALPSDTEIQKAAHTGLHECYLQKARHSSRAAELQRNAPRRDANSVLVLYDAAVAAYGEASKLVSGSPPAEELSEARYQRALLLLEVRRAAEALAAFRDFAQPYKDSLERQVEAQILLYVESARKALAAGDLEAAGRDAEGALKLRDQLQSQSIRSRRAAELEEAQTLLTKVRGKMFFQAGADALREGKFEQARTQFMEVLRALDPGEPEHSQAKAELNKLENTPKLEFINRNLASGNNALSRREWSQARTYFATALDVLKEMKLDTAPAEEGLRRVQEGLERRILYWCLAGAAALVVAGAVFIFASPSRLTWLYKSLGLFERAYRLNEKQVRQNPTNRRALLRLAGVAAQLGDRRRITQAVSNYLTMEKKDPEIELLGGELAFESGDRELASLRFHRTLALGLATKAVYERILKVTADGAPDPSHLALYEGALASGGPTPEVVRLLAPAYQAASRRDEQALRVFREMLTLDPDKVELRMISARDYLDRQQPARAIEELRAILERRPDMSGALDMLIEACREESCLEPTFGALNACQVPVLQGMRVIEEVISRHPAARSRAHAEYQRTANDRTCGFNEQSLLHAHLAIDEGRLEMAEHLLLAVQCPDGGTDLRNELIRAFDRLLEAQGEDRSPGLLFRVAELCAGGHHPGPALAALQRIQRLPEWKLRARRAIDDILDTLAAGEVARKFFDDAGWAVNSDGELWVSAPAGKDAKIREKLGRARLNCLDRGLGYSDVLTLKERLLADAAGAAGFLVGSERPRRDVYALIYALLAETPSTMIVPLDLPAMKEAIGSGSCAECLRRTLNLWLGRGDVYDEHNPISDAAVFFGRGQLLHLLVTKILNRQNFGLYGLRKMGKTSLVFQLRENLPRNVLLGYVELQGIPTRTCGEVYCRLIEALREELRTKFPGATQPEFRLAQFDSRAPVQGLAADFQHDLQLLKRVLDVEGKEPRVLLLLDEIELMIPQEDEGEPGFEGFETFFRQLRGLYQQDGVVISAVVGADPTLCRKGRWAGLDNPVFQYYDEVFLSPLERAECDQMVQGLGAVMGAGYSPASLQLIYEESNGHPYVTRQLCSRILHRQQQRPLEVDAGMVREGIEDYIMMRPDYFRGIFQSYLNDQARAVLEWMARQGQTEVGCAELFAMSGATQLARDRFARALQDLELFQLLVRDKDLYRLPMRLLYRWLRADWLGIEKMGAVT